MVLTFPEATKDTTGTDNNLTTVKSMRGSKLVVDLGYQDGLMSVAQNYIENVGFKDLTDNLVIDPLTDILWINPRTNKIVFKNKIRAINTVLNLEINNLKNPPSFDQ